MSSSLSIRNRGIRVGIVSKIKYIIRSYGFLKCKLRGKSVCQLTVPRNVIVVCILLFRHELHTDYVLNFIFISDDMQRYKL